MLTSEHISSAQDFWEIVVKRDYEEFRGAATDLRKAFHVAISLHHVCDWVLADYCQRDPEKIFGKNRLVDLQKHIIENECRDYWLIRDIGNASKHFRLTRPADPPVAVHSSSATTVQASGFGMGPFGAGTWGGRRIIVDTDSGPRLFSEIAEKVYEMWDRLFREKGW